MVKSLVFFVCVIFLSQAAVGQIRSNGTGGGLWYQQSTWLGGKVPVGGNSAGIIIRAGDVVQIPAAYSVSIDQMTIEAGAVVRVLSGGLMTIANGAGTDLMIQNNGSTTGVLTVAGTLVLSQSATTAEVGSVPSPVLTSATTTIQNGGVYLHNYFFSAGTIIGANWEDGSRIEIRRLTTPDNIPGNLNQNYYDFIWDCPGQRSHLNFNGNLTNVRNNLTIGSTGGVKLRIFGASSNNTLNVGGNFLIESDPLLYFSDGGINNVVNVGGDFINNASSVNIFLANAGSVEFNVLGDFLYNNPSGRIFMGNAGGAFTRLNLHSNVNIAGQLRTNNGGRGDFEFLGNTQYSGGGSFIGTFNFTIHPAATLNLGTSYVSNNSGAFRLRSGGTLVLGAYNGAGTNALGAIQNNTSQGNVRTNVGSRLFEAGSSIVYGGIAAQQIGLGHPNGVNLVIDNPVSVTALKNFSAAQVNLEQGAFNTSDFSVTLSGDWVVNNGALNPGTGPLVFNGTSNVTGTGVKNFGNVIVQNLATVNLPDENVTITGNLTVSPTAILQTNQSTVIFAGGAAQSVSPGGTTFYNVNVNKSGGDVTLTSAMNMRNLLNIQTATAFNSDGHLTLLSTGDRPAVDAAIGPLAGGASVNGDVTVQRYQSAIGQAWRFISSPVQNAPVSMLQDDFPVTGKFTGTSYPCTGCANNGPSLTWYDPTWINREANLRFRRYPTSSNTQTLVVGRGYSAYMWQDAVSNMDLTGPINAGAISLPVALGVSTPPNPGADGWNLVGNPYPSAIAWNGGAGWSLTNISPIVSVEEAGSGGVWHTYNYTDNSGDLPNGIIAMGQGFWVYATASGPALQINEQAKTSATGHSYYREKAPEQSRQLIVTLESGEKVRKAYLKVNSQATPDFDGMFDAYPLPIEMMEGFNISLVDRNGAGLLMHTQSDFPSDTEIPLRLQVPARGEYTLRFNNDGNFPHTQALYLFDKSTGVTTALSATTPYSFAAADSGAIANRFYLTMNPAMEQKVDNLISVHPNPFSSRLKIEVASDEAAVLEMLDARGQRLSTHVFVRQIELETDDYRPGVYIARVKTSQGIVTRKVVRQ